MADGSYSMPEMASYKRIMNGVFIHERAGAKHGIWQLHARIDGELFRESLKTTDEDEAITKAAKRAEELKARKYQGKPVRKVPFSELCDDYLESVAGEMKHDYQRDTIRRYYGNYFDNRFDDVCEITPNDMLEYRAWRKTLRDKVPSNGTLNRERSVFSQLMKHAVKRGYLKKENVVEQERERETSIRDRRRYHFNSAQYNRLHRCQQKRINEAKKDPKLRGIQLEHRQMLYWFILFMANTGLRPDREFKDLRWRDIDFRNEQLEVRSGKRGARTVSVDESAMIVLGQMLERRKKYAAENTDNAGVKSFSIDEFVWSTKGGTRVVDFKKQFNELLRAVGFSIEEQRKFTPYSLRHTYATFAINRGVPTSHLAAQMGTSEKMIEQIYNHAEATNLKESLRRGRKSRYIPQKQAQRDKKIR